MQTHLSILHIQFSHCTKSFLRRVKHLFILSLYKINIPVQQCQGSLATQLHFYTQILFDTGLQWLGHTSNIISLESLCTLLKKYLGFKLAIDELNCECTLSNTSWSHHYKVIGTSSLLSIFVSTVRTKIPPILKAKVNISLKTSERSIQIHPV